MTKYICNGRSTSGITCHTLCKCEVDSGVRGPTECLLDERECTWRLDCTTEEKKEELPEGIDWMMTTHHNEERITDLDKKVQELEQMLQNHIHYIAGTTGKPRGERND